MPEAAPIVPTPSNHPAAKTPAPAAATQTATPPPEVGAVDWSAKYKALEAEHQKKQREQIIERRKWDGERKTSGERLTKLEQLEKREQSAKVNPVGYLKSVYGEDWQKIINEAALTGATPAQLVQESIDKLREEFEAKDKSRAEESTKAAETQRQQAQDNARQTIFAESAAWYRAKASEFPLLAKIGAEPAVARTMAQRIEHEFNKTGKILTAAEAAELIEGDVLEWAREATKHEKYKAKLQPAPASSTVAPSKQQQGTQQPAAARRSITNDITGSTSPAKPPASDKERLARATAAWDAAKAKRG